MKKIRVKDIRSEGLQVSDTILPTTIGLKKEDCLSFTEPLEITAELERIDSSVLADTDVHGHYESFCSRCLEPIISDWHNHFQLDFEVDKNTEFIDLEDDIRQEILVSLPTQVWCKKDCQGLCKSCGANLNKEKCRCSKVKKS